MTNGPDNLSFYVSGSVLLLVCAFKVPALIRRRHDPLLRAACLLLFVGGCEMILVAPGSITALNRITGVTNIAAPVVYSVLIAFAGTTLLLLINWRPAPPEKTRRISRMCVRAYSLTVVAVAVLFWAGETPVEQVTLFDVHYANTPYIRELIVTYLVAQGVAMTAASTLCWRWSKKVRGSLQAGLHILAAAYLLTLSYDLMRLTAVAARWTGHDLDFLIDPVSVQLAPPVALLGAIGFALPLAGPRLSRTTRVIRELRELTPLWRALQDVPTPGAHRASVPWWRTPPAVLLTARKTALYDAILALAPYCDPAVRHAVHRAVVGAGGDEWDAAVTAEAAMILAARDQQRSHPEQVQEALDSGMPRTKDLVPLSRALTSSGLPDLLRHATAP